MSYCNSCDKVTSQFVTDDGEYYYPMCGECY
jgi:hypothetical protein